MLVAIATWDTLLAHAEDELDLEAARTRLADRRLWLDADELDSALADAQARAAAHAVR